MPKRKRTNWYGHYGGPGNRIDDEWVRSHPPVDDDDVAYLEHDREYAALQRQYGRKVPYFLYSRADDRLVSKIAGSSKPFARGARAWFGFKKTLSPYSLITRNEFGKFREEYNAHRSTPALLPPYTPDGSEDGEPPRSSSMGTRGTYQGRFAKPRAAVAGKYAYDGYRREREEFGTQSGTDVCYLGMSSVSAKEIGQCVGIAFIRKVMRRHYMREYADERENLRVAMAIPDSALALVQPLPYALRFIRKVEEVNAVIAVNAPAEYVFNDTDTVRDFGQWFEGNVFNSLEYGGGVVGNQDYNSRISLFAYQFVEVDYFDPANIPPVYWPKAIMPLHGMYLTCYSKADMHIQNITVADGGGELAYDADRIDSNPIRGRIFKFKGPLPKVKYDMLIANGAAAVIGNSIALDIDPNADGIIKPQADLTGAWRAPPTADMFHNCVGVTSVSLEPGAIRNFSLQFKYSGLLVDLIHGMRATVGSAPLPGGRNLGTSMLFALEKRVRTGTGAGGQAVNLNWHADVYTGAVMGGTRRSTMARSCFVPGTLVSGNDSLTVPAAATTAA